MILEIIQYETDDKITLIKRNYGYGLFDIFWIMLVFFVSTFGLYYLIHNYYSGGTLILLMFLIFWVLYALSAFLLKISETVTLDKKSQIAIIRKDSNINLLKSITKIPFVNLREIKLERVCPTEGYIVSLITLEGKVVCSNFTNSESEAEKIAKKLSDFTCLEIYHGIIVDNSSD